MDKLIDQNGFTILETLVGILLLGLIITFFAMFFNQVFANPKLLLRKEAMVLANQEIERCINYKPKSDTTYFNNNGNLKIYRKLKSSNSLTKAVVTVKVKSSEKEILSFSVMYR